MQKEHDLHQKGEVKAVCALCIITPYSSSAGLGCRMTQNNSHERTMFHFYSCDTYLINKLRQSNLYVLFLVPGNNFKIYSKVIGYLQQCCDILLYYMLLILFTNIT